MVVREFINLIGFKVNRTQLQNVERSVQKVADKMQSIGTKMTLAITTPFVAMSAFSIKAASDANEIQSAFNQVFGDLSDEANKFAENFANSLERADTSFKDALTSLQSFTVGMGLTKEAAFEASKEILELGLDLSSFRNVPFEEVIGRFRSALSGSSEAVDQFGINLKAAAIESKAAELGIKGTVTQMGEMDKVLIRLAIIRDTMGRQGAIGDAIRTNKEFANRLRSASEQVKKLGIVIGKILLPPAQKMLNIFIKLVKSFSKINPTILKIILAIGGAAAVVGPLALALSALASVLTTTGLVLTAVSVPIIALIGWIGLLADDIITFIRGGRSLIGTFLPPWEKLFKVLSERSKSFFSTITNAFNLFKSSLKGVADAFDLIVVGIRLDHDDMIDEGFANLRTSVGKSLDLLIDFIIEVLIKVIPKIFKLMGQFEDKFGEIGRKFGEAIAFGILDALFSKLKGSLSGVGAFLFPEAADILKRRKTGETGSGGLPGVLKNLFPKANDILEQRTSLNNLGLGVAGAGAANQTRVNTTINLSLPAEATSSQVSAAKSSVEKAFESINKKIQLAGARVEQ